jgi:hypothetical protein
MDSINKILILLLVLIIGFSVSYSEYSLKSSSVSESLYKPISSPQILCSTDYGYVARAGPYGNKSSQFKVAYIVGVHPMELNSHTAIILVMNNQKNSMKYCYYIYAVKVTRNASNYNDGRINGQKLAYNYVLPDIMAKNITLVVDVHSNRGFYKEKRFISVPVHDITSESIAFQIINKVAWLVFYIPPTERGPTSGPFVTIPLIKSGISAFVYETYIYEPYETTLKHAKDFINAVDQTNLDGSKKGV